MKDIRERLAQIESDVAKRFTQLLKDQADFEIIDADDILNGECPDDYFEMRNDITGNVFDVHVIRVTEEGILVMEADDYSKKHLISLSKLGSIDDRINLCGLMEERLTKV
jgi:hypothetical protein